jgi:uncharacterized protein (DUF983 family)
MDVVRSLWDGFRLICPVCHKGRMFQGFTMHRACPVCGVVFEREVGSRSGGMYINISVTGVLFGIGLITMANVSDIPLDYQFIIWLIFAVIFPIVFYRQTRGLWVGILNVLGMVYRD